MSAASPEQLWSERFDALAAQRSAEPAWLEAARKAAAARFAELGFPTRRLEEWRYTNPAPIAKTAWREADAASPGRAALDALGLPLGDDPRLVFVNGRLEPALSSRDALDPSLALTSFGEALETEPGLLEPVLTGDDALADRALAQLARAIGSDGAFLRIPRGLDVSAPVWLLFLSVPGAEPAATHPRFAVVAEDGSRVTLHEVHASVGEGAHLCNALGEIRVGANASLEHVKLLIEARDATHLAHTALRVARDGRLASTLVSLGGSVARHDVVAVLDGEGASCDLDGLYVARDGQHVDIRTTVDHRRPHGASRELVKGVLSGRSRGVFSGKVIVRREAQRTDAQQKNDNLLLSRGAEVDSKPQLEIEADDVKCSHGSTIGQLEPDALFYLRSRGIGEADAIVLLTRAFGAQVLERVGHAALREHLDARVQDWLFGGRPR